MPSRRLHLKFDEYLKEHNIICDRDCSIVHERMDRDLQVYGHWNHQYTDYYHYENGIRNWIKKWAHLGYQDTLTDYVLDEMRSKYKSKNDEELIKTAYRSYAQRRFYKRYFKE
jgi:hypothetical protein